MRGGREKERVREGNTRKGEERKGICPSFALYLDTSVEVPPISNPITGCLVSGL